MIFRVGAKPLSNRSVYKIHEDCEVGAGNNLENASAKGTTKIVRICAYLRMREYYIDSERNEVEKYHV